MSKVHYIRANEERRGYILVALLVVLVVATIVAIMVLPPEGPRCRDIYANTPLAQVPAGCLDKGSLK